MFSYIYMSRAYATPCGWGGFSCTGPTAVDRDKGNLNCRMDIYLPGLGYGPEDSQLQLKNRLYKNEHVMKQW